MSDRSLEIENQRLRREVERLKRELDSIKRIGRKEKEYKAEPAQVVPSTSYDARNPIAPGKDPVWDAWQASRNRRRSWLD
jgi:hypothetical protein